MADKKGKVHLLDYVAGNIRSLVNAIEKCGWEVEWIRSPEDVKNAEVGHFSSDGHLCHLAFGVQLSHVFTGVGQGSGGKEEEEREESMVL